MAAYEIPLRPMPSRFAITLGGNVYQLVVQYRDAAMGGWVLDFNDQFGGPIACGIPLVTGANLIEQYAYLGLPGQMWVYSDGTPDAVPTFGNLGVGSHLLWIYP
jgi:hypothetical protein